MTDTFARDYLKRLLVPPALVTTLASILFIGQVEQLTAAQWAGVVALLIASHAAASAAFIQALRPHVYTAAEAAHEDVDASRALSRLLMRTEVAGFLLFGAGTVLFAVLATVFVERTALAFRHFLLGAILGEAATMMWIYAAAKKEVTKLAEKAKDARYTGWRLTFGRKIAIVFIGFFFIFVAAVAQLISTKVSRTLENLAVNDANVQMNELVSSFDKGGPVTAEQLAAAGANLPPDHRLVVIRSDGTVAGPADALTPAEVEHIARIGTGSSTQFVSPHVVTFRRLASGEILALSLPWTPYAAIPFQITLYTFLTASFAALMLGWISWFLSRDVQSALREVMRVSHEMARGNFQVREHVFADDEIGQLADSFRETRSNLKRLIARVGGSGTVITDGVKVITGGTDTLMVRSREQNILTTTSNAAVDEVRAGISEVLRSVESVADLTHDSASRATELQASNEEVGRSMDYLFQSVEKTSSSTTEMDAAARAMSERTDVLAGIGEEVLSFVAEMESTIQELQRNANATAEISRRVQEDASQGGRAVHDTVAGIETSQKMTGRASVVLSDLQRSVGQISQILEVIEDIADRTNLLSLNAAIIAAQAGEHGSSFTVVADEIRQLAERTRGSTKEIAGIIKAIQGGTRGAIDAMQEGVSRVNDSAALAANASASLEKIVSSATKSFDMANRIASSLNEQATAARKLHEVTSRMSDHITEINRSTTEQARGTRLLANEAEKVRDIALQVKNSTQQQVVAGMGITHAMEQIATDVEAVRLLLQQQLSQTEQIAEASRTMLKIAQQNEEIAEAFNSTVRSLVSSGQAFESEVKRFRVVEH